MSVCVVCAYVCNFVALFLSFHFYMVSKDRTQIDRLVQ